MDIKLPPSEHVMLFFIWSCVNNDAAKCSVPSVWISRLRFEQQGYDVKSTRQKLLRNLEKKGWFTREHAHRGKSTVFHLAKGSPFQKGTEKPTPLSSDVDERAPENQHPIVEKGHRKTGRKGTGKPDERAPENQHPMEPSDRASICNPKEGDSNKKKPANRLTRSQKRRQKVESNSPVMIRIGSWFKQRPETLWTNADAQALEELSITEEELDLLEAYHSAPWSKLGKREDGAFVPATSADISSLLNNWPNKVMHARTFAEVEAEKPSAAAKQAEVVSPDILAEACAATRPETTPFRRWDDVPDPVKPGLAAWIKANQPDHYSDQLAA